MKRLNPLLDDSSSDDSSLPTKRIKKAVVIPLQKDNVTSLLPSIDAIPVNPAGTKNTPYSEKKLFKHDVETRPDVSSLDDYDDVPVEAFGEAMLRGMGWSKGKSLGKNNSGLKEIVEMKPRARLLGLGATPFTLDAAVKMDKPAKNKTVVEKPISRSPTRRESSGSAKRIRWLTRQTRVRYLCTSPPRKLLVVDVHATTCTLQDQSSGKIYDDVVERDCETIVPGEGGRVVVVRGRDKGCAGRVVRRERRRERVAVELDAGGIWEGEFDECCEYVGEDDE